MHFLIPNHFVKVMSNFAFINRSESRNMQIIRFSRHRQGDFAMCVSRREVDDVTDERTHTHKHTRRQAVCQAVTPCQQHATLPALLTSYCSYGEMDILIVLAIVYTSLWAYSVTHYITAFTKAVTATNTGCLDKRLKPANCNPSY